MEVNRLMRSACLFRVFGFGAGWDIAEGVAFFWVAFRVCQPTLARARRVQRLWVSRWYVCACVLGFGGGLAHAGVGPMAGFLGVGGRQGVGQGWAGAAAQVHVLGWACLRAGSKGMGMPCCLQEGRCVA